jgi:hypothetical protein
MTTTLSPAAAARAGIWDAAADCLRRMCEEK